MSQRNTIVRSMHDLGLAAWFGGALMGTIGLNGAAAEAQPAAQRLRLASIGWSRWAPVQLGALVLHGIGGVGLIMGNKTRLFAQQEGRTNTIVKGAITLAAVGATAYSAVIGMRMGEHSGEAVEGVTEASADSSSELASAQRQQRVLQWVVPVLTGVLIIMAAQQGEQQRPIAGLLETTKKNIERGKKRIARGR